MLAYVVIVVSRGSYRYHVARRQSCAFVRDAGQALRGGAFDEVITIAARKSRSPVATMVATGLTAFASAPSQCTIADAIDIASRAFQHCQRKLAADFSLSVGTLKSIASTSPLLGLAGTCLGIMSAFRGIGMEKHAALVMVAKYVAAALFTTASGLLVAIPAVWSYNYLRVRLDRIESEMSNMALEAITHLNSHQQWRNRREDFVAGSETIISADAVACSGEVRHQGERIGRHKLPSAKRISEPPAFALLAAPSLALAVAGFMTFSSFRNPMGLDVLLLKPGELVKKDDLSVGPIVVALETSSDGQTAVYVNSKKTPWEKLASTVSDEVKIRPPSIAYVQPGNNVPWADVANAIAAVENLPDHIVLLTSAPSTNPSHRRRSRKPMK
ncbi:MAG: MotA/TolQ/ExbB proton channel family protein [Acidobacteriia bacterium]|nr:MotA/TolQ/ExbB proton channel family protein [Terriglobia bacterium]